MAEMMNTGIGLGDAMNLCQNANGGWNQMWNNPFMYLIWLAIFGNGAFGFGGNARAEAGYNLADIQNSIYASNDAQTNALNSADNFRNVNQQINAIGDGIASSTFALKDAITGLGAGVHDGFDKVNYGLMENRFVGQQGVSMLQASLATINNNIDSVKYDNAKNACAITTAIHNEGEQTRALIQANTMQALRDKLCETQQKLTSAEFTISQQLQNQYLISQLKTTA